MDDVSFLGLGMVGWNSTSNSFVFREAVCLLKHEIVKQFYINLLCLCFADSSLLKTIDGAHLDCEIKNHPALDSMMHLLPENVLVSGDENIPGLAASPTGKLHITEMVSGQIMTYTLPYNNRCFKVIESQLLQWKASKEKEIRRL